eukprot:scaffold2004_cov420-Prasinococcus_capsulatus_cf.AAC.23
MHVTACVCACRTSRLFLVTQSHTLTEPSLEDEATRLQGKALWTGSHARDVTHCLWPYSAPSNTLGDHPTSSTLQTQVTCIDVSGVETPREASYLAQAQWLAVDIPQSNGAIHAPTGQ